MGIKQLGAGDIVYSKVEIRNDGTIPEAKENELLADIGNRGVLINIGQLENDPTQSVYLVSFDKEDGTSGPLVACGEAELSEKPIATA